jgi:hypothetical protein
LSWVSPLKKKERAVEFRGRAMSTRGPRGRALRRTGGEVAMGVSGRRSSRQWLRRWSVCVCVFFFELECVLSVALTVFFFLLSCGRRCYFYSCSDIYISWQNSTKGTVNRKIAVSMEHNLGLATYP